MQYEHCLTASVLLKSQYGHLNVADLPGFLRSHLLKCLYDFTCFTILILQKYVPNNFLMTIITRLAVYDTMYNSNV